MFSDGKTKLMLPDLPVSPNQKNNLNSSEKLLEFSKYLKSLIMIPEIIKTRVMLSFLEIPVNIRVMLFINLQSRGLESNVDNLDSDNVIDEFLKNLNETKKKLKIIKNFESHYFMKKPKLESKVIKRLFKGVGIYDGLIKTCGSFEKSFTMSCAALLLLFNLIDREKNSNAEYFLSELGMLEKSELVVMNLHEHILSERGSKTTAFKIIELISLHYKNFLGECVTDEWSREEYSKWKFSKEIKMNRIMSSKSMLKKIPNIKNLDLDEFFRSKREKLISELNSKEVDKYKVLCEKYDMRYCYDSGQKNTTLKFGFTVNSDVSKLKNNIYDVNAWKKWCVKFHSSSFNKLSENTHISFSSFKSFISPYKYTAVCFLSNLSELENGFLITGNSVESDLIPKYQLNYKQSSFMTSGMRAVQKDKESVRVECCLQFYDNCIVMFSSDILGESSDLIDSVKLFIKLCESYNFFSKNIRFVYYN